MSVQYIPSPDGDFMVWLDNFSSLISADPTQYGLTSADAIPLAALTATFSAALAAATNGTTRGPATIAAKDAARANAEARARFLASVIQLNPTITNEQKEDLRITVRKTSKTPIPEPTTSPLLAFVAATPEQHTLRYSDQLTPDSRARPFGVSALQLSVWIRAVGTAPSGPPDHVLLFTKNPMAVNFDEEDIAKMATYKGRWSNPRGKLGPVSATLSRVIV